MYKKSSLFLVSCFWILKGRVTPALRAKGCVEGGDGPSGRGLWYRLFDSAFGAEGCGRRCAAGFKGFRRFCPLPAGGFKGCGIALWAMSFICRLWRQRCQRQRKPNNRACGPLEMHPFCLRHLPRRGRFALHSAFVLISISKHNAAKTSPSGGSGAQHPKGCISIAPQARLYGFPFREAEL